MAPDQIRKSSVVPDSADSYRAAIQGAAAATWGAAQRAPAALSQIAEAASGVGGAAAGAAGLGGGVAAAVVGVQSPAGNAGEDAPTAGWRAQSKAASDHAPMAAHPVESSTTVTPADPSRGIQHTGQTRAADRISSTTSTPIEHAGSSTTATPVHRPGALTTTTPVTHRSSADSATLVVNARELQQQFLPGAHVSHEEVTKVPPAISSALRKDFNAAGGPKERFIKDAAENHVDQLQKAGFSRQAIADMKHGDAPPGWQVHHIKGLQQGGDNSAQNLVLLRDVPEHRKITGQQNSAMSQIPYGETGAVDVLRFPESAIIYPPTGK